MHVPATLVSEPPPASAEAPRSIDGSNLTGSLVERRISRVIIVFIVAIGVHGWSRRESLPSSEAGQGYALGIIGSAMMLLLLLYPVRKRLRPQHWSGTVGLWFRIHMLLGLLGPLAILYHARFTYSATNSAVALAAMMVVVASGLIGRFIYGHVHRGFSQRRLEVRELGDELAQSRLLLDADGDTGHHVVERLAALERVALARRPTLVGNLGIVLILAVRTRVSYWTLRRMIHAELAIAGRASGRKRGPPEREVVRHLARYLAAIRQLGEFAFYDRLMRAWHYLHLPLFGFLLAAAALHVIAVHMY